MEKTQEQRRFFRVDTDLPAAFFIQSEDYLKRNGRVVNVSGSGCMVRIQSMESIPSDETHQVSFELPSRPQPLEFDCMLVSAQSQDGDNQDLRLHFIKPRAGDQDAIVTYVQNKKRFDAMAFRVNIPVSVEAQSGLRQFVPYKGQTLEVGKDYAVCEMTSLGLAASSEVIATFQAPHFRDEVFFSSMISKVEKNTRGGYVIRLMLANPADQMIEFVRKHYGDKAKNIPAAAAR